MDLGATGIGVIEAEAETGTDSPQGETEVVMEGGMAAVAAEGETRTAAGAEAGLRGLPVADMGAAERTGSAEVVAVVAAMEVEGEMVAGAALSGRNSRRTVVPLSCAPHFHRELSFCTGVLNLV